MKKLSDLTKESGGSTRLLWAHDYYDGPINGMVLWEGKKAWFEQGEERFDKVPMSPREIEALKKYPDAYSAYEAQGFVETVEIRQYKVYAVTEEEFSPRDHNVSFWIETVGNSWRYDEINRRVDTPVKPGFEANYERYKKECLPEPPISMTEDRLLGEFEW